MPGAGCFVLGAEYRVPGSWDLEPGTWNLEPGTLFRVPEAIHFQLTGILLTELQVDISYFFKLNKHLNGGKYYIF